MYYYRGKNLIDTTKTETKKIDTFKKWVVKTNHQKLILKTNEYLIQANRVQIYPFSSIKSKWSESWYIQNTNNKSINPFLNKK